MKQIINEIYSVAVGWGDFILFPRILQRMEDVSVIFSSAMKPFRAEPTRVKIVRMLQSKTARFFHLASERDDSFSE